MPQRVTLDAMIPREDFARESDQVSLNLFGDFPISHLDQNSPYIRLIRKPDFQRETNHWSPEQLATFIASFVDAEVIPSLILWHSPTYIFVIDGGHRISALRAWVNDDYGDGPISLAFYKGEIPNEQRKIATRARNLIEQRVGRFSKLRDLAAAEGAPEIIRRRATVLLTRALALQWIQGNAAAAETSFFKINSQGTPLDETEEMLIKNRKKPIAIGARAILRSGSGHKYWSSFSEENKAEIELIARKFYNYVFKPEAEKPVRTLDIPIGGSVAPIDALSLLIDFLEIAGSSSAIPKPIGSYEDDHDGTVTIKALNDAFRIIERITGNSPASLGLHPAVYFYNERGRYSRFLFLGMTSLIVEKIKNNDHNFFKKYTSARNELEKFLIANKSLVTNILQNLSKKQRVPKIKSLFDFLINRFSSSQPVTPEDAITHIGLSVRIFDVKAGDAGSAISDETKSMVFIRNAIATAIKCPLCNGLMDPQKSMSYDHIQRVREGGNGEAGNVQIVHPYCNSIRN
ncbi:Protein of unknown function DUF262 [Methylobacterium sp. UNC300MFChir4.1]|uniref:HNH endonuclease family protein n=1 Tax=Methylobacterium sp. UNC300MFChir4.1 TaxID=1502747 RepID=UPI0008CDE07B|nr:DUF262 domain-containing protein [Methylobacterium sp. UNC300MFChir4.1]SEP22549.1 Protein of unknown function DUF262 [Methylobacterium sp. UNC300MFChir4.1]